MPDTRVVVFIDYQNVYHGARTLFGGHGWTPPTFGNVHPLEYAQMVCDLGLEVDPRRVLAGVRVYRGQPVPGVGHDKVCRSFDRQVAVWQKTPGVQLFTKPLRYSRETDDAGNTYMAGREKGVDVMMALDIAIGALKNSYDVAVAATADTDFIPALEHALAVGKRVETSMWWTKKAPRGPITIKNRPIWNHNLDETKFNLIRDDTDYLAGS